MSRITIPEMDAMDISSSELMNMLNEMCGLYVEKLEKLYPSTAIDDVGGYVRQICAKVVRMSRTLEIVAGQEHDYVVSNCIIRCMADNVASLLFVYDRSTDEMLLRHFLFVIDGISTRHQMKLEKPIVKDDQISQVEFDALKKQIDDSIENERECLDFCIKAVRGLPYYAEHMEQCEVLLEKNNWKFVDIEKPKMSIKWEQMYDVLKLKSEDIFPFLSQYVHGLSASNIVTPYSEDDFQPIWSFAIVLMGKLREFMEKFYGLPIDKVGISATELFALTPDRYLKKLFERTGF